MDELDDAFDAEFGDGWDEVGCNGASILASREIWFDLICGRPQEEEAGEAAPGDRPTERDYHVENDSAEEEDAPGGVNG